MKARLKYNGYIDKGNKRFKTILLSQGHILKETQNQIIISILGTASTIKKKDILQKYYVEDLEEINYARI